LNKGQLLETTLSVKGEAKIGPGGGEVSLNIKDVKKYDARWFNPRKGDLTPARSGIVKERVTFVKKDNENEPSDWVLVLESKK